MLGHRKCDAAVFPKCSKIAIQERKHRIRTPPDESCLQLLGHRTAANLMQVCLCAKASTPPVCVKRPGRKDATWLGSLGVLVKGIQAPMMLLPYSENARINACSRCSPARHKQADVLPPTWPLLLSPFLLQLRPWFRRKTFNGMPQNA